MSRRFGDALRSADPQRAAAVIREALRDGVEPEAVQADVIAPAMNWIGDLWERGAVTVADEHLATAISYGCLAELYPALLRSEPDERPTVLVCAVEGEQHVLGARMAADVLEGAGYRTMFLGPDVPTEALALAVARHEAAVVCLSLHMSLGANRLERAVEAVQAARPSSRVVLAGRGVPATLRRELPFVEATTQLLPTIEEALGGEDQPRIAVSGDACVQLVAAGPTVEEQVAQATAYVADVARQSAREAERFRRMALEDPLTGLPNRRAFEDRLAEIGASREPSLLVLDVDGFKLINDALGHAAGDAALRRLGNLISSAIRPSDFAARLGGDEFAVLLVDVSPYEAACVAERLRAVIEQDEETPRLTVSIGVSRCHGDIRGAALHADEALYAAKRSGRNAVQVAPDER